MSEDNTTPPRRRLAAIALIGSLLALPAAAAEPAGPLTIARQGSFFVGGRSVASDTLSTLPAYAPSGTISVDQVYVRYQIPVEAKRPAIVLIHGCCLTGKTWETTPDGRMGWDEFFVRAGFPTYVIDQAGRGRSAVDPSRINAVKTGQAAPETLPPVVSAGQEPAWAIFRFGPKYPEVFPGMQFPLEAQAEFWKQMVADWAATLPTPNPTVPALSELAKTIEKTGLDGAILISHSQSGIYPFQTAALDRAGIRGLVAIEPAACPDPAKDDLAPYRDLPILVLWGDYVERVPRWAPRLKLCRAFVEAANKAGGMAELVLLPDVGMACNSHMLMQDRNSLDVAAWLAAWLDAHVPPRP
ncbi:esterase [Methylobacterium sp. WL30]|uniref:esterase n=1 Tax=unclassified Methylobacterium TaxID=2615210 RepID=UPI0011C81726|nr:MULTISPECIES: esterase [unclassified Methylobacterium]TXM91750.1 esterase [Methylobacterium sp. WL116]TXN39976.1 esterase [Methylobacterium sp. WL93]TXN51904.1 esterase [Methylobacterium sp. WL119]TXN66052.1 esterase [Methylobacterium sp. WL30]